MNDEFVVDFDLLNFDPGLYVLVVIEGCASEGVRLKVLHDQSSKTA